jgi:hypothetical protein
LSDKINSVTCTSCWDLYSRISKPLLPELRLLEVWADSENFQNNELQSIAQILKELIQKENKNYCLSR